MTSAHGLKRNVEYLQENNKKSQAGVVVELCNDVITGWRYRRVG